MAERNILIVDDEARIREVVQYALERQGYRVTAVSTGEDAVSHVARAAVDLIVLDITLPGADGLEVCKQIRTRVATPILFLSARGEEIDRVVGLEVGGDDYLTKPFSPRELVARVKAILRRTDSTSQPAPPANQLIAYGPIRIDVERHEVRCGNDILHLTPTEFGVLHALLERPGFVLSRVQLMQRAYPFDNHVTDRTIDTHVRRLRNKFRKLGVDPIATVHGVGYKAAELGAPCLDD